MAQLESYAASSPGDARAWVLLARRRMDADQFELACAAYARALALSRKVASDPQVWAEYADALGMAQAGRLAGKPKEAIGRALALDPRHPKALELAGSAAYEARDFRSAQAHWRALLDLLPPDSPQRLPLRAAVHRADRLARLSLPATDVN
jgi:cytochrome c-type biogenesis protein CcmH